MKRSHAITCVAAIAAALVVLTAGITGCSDDDPGSGKEKTGEFRIEERGLIRRAESENAEVILRYLKPSALAAAEEREEGATIPRDSLAGVYDRSLSFTLTVRKKGEDFADVQPASAGESGVEFHSDGVIDLEVTQRKFRLLSGGKEWSPIVALPEAHVGGEESWFVVFPIDLQGEHPGEEVTLIYHDPDSGEPPIQFTYEADELLRPEQFASNR